MVAILPHEFLDLIAAQYPCRETQSQTLLTIYNGIFPPPPVLVVHGLAGTHKLEVVTAVLTARKLPHVVVRCRECLSQRHLLGKIFAECVRALELSDTLEQYARVDSINAFAVNLQRLFGEDGQGRRAVQRCVLVLDAVDEVRGAGPTLLAALGRLGDLVPKLSMIFTTTSPRPLPLHRAGVPYVHFPPYTRAEAVHMVTLETHPLPDNLRHGLNAEDLPKIYKQFAITVYDALIAPTTLSISLYKQVLGRLWPRFVWPAVCGEQPTGRAKVWDFSRLLIRNRTLFHGAGESALLDSLEGGGKGWGFEDLMREQEQQQQSGDKSVGTPRADQRITTATAGTQADQNTPLLAPLPTLLLLATHLCSHTPSKHDILLFSRLSNSATKHRKIRYIKRGNPGTTPKKANEDGRRKDKTKSLAPKACGLERILAVGRAVSVDDINGAGTSKHRGKREKDSAQGWSDRVARAMGELERMRLVRREDGAVSSGTTGGEGDGVASSTSVGSLGGGRWRINVGREVVEELAKRCGLGVLEWELDL